MLEILTKLRRKSWNENNLVLSPGDQIKVWQKTARVKWPLLTQAQQPQILQDDAVTLEKQGWLGPLLFHGFGDDGRGNSDQVHSGDLAWRRIKGRHRKTWRCEYADFNRPEDMRLRPEAPRRPKGFYWAYMHPGEEFKNTTITQFRKALSQGVTGLAAEGLQLLAVTHPHLADLMEQEKYPFMALADYDVAPHGFNDFFESPQLFKSRGVVGMGVGNVDGTYPRFAIPRLFPIGWC